VRVLLIANTLPPADVSGVGEQVLQLAAGLRARGHQVRVLGRGPEGARGPKVLFALTVVPACARALAEFRPDIVQVHESDGALAALWVRLARRSGHPRLVALLQVSYVEERRAVRRLRFGARVLGAPGGVERRFRWFKAPLQILLGRWSARLADRVLAPSVATAAELARDYGVAGAAVVPNATGGLPWTTERVPAVDSERDFLLFVGRLRIRKGVEVLLEAMAGPTVSAAAGSLLIAGDGEHRERLERRATELGLRAPAVRFLGRVSGAQVRDLLGRARALVVPSIYEGMPLVVLEAMAAGVPVVASRVSGIPEVVVDGETGWLVPCEDPVALSEALAMVLGSPEEARRRGEAGRERLERSYGPSQVAQVWEALVSPPGGGGER
jgi:glycosyltransferase involved in cell wall biosynthesis